VECALFSTNQTYGGIGEGFWWQSTILVLLLCRPNRVQALTGHRVVQLAAGLRHSVALCSDNSVCAWGSNDQGQLGQGRQLPEERALSPMRLPLKALPELPILYIAAGGVYDASYKESTRAKHTAYFATWQAPPNLLLSQPGDAVPLRLRPLHRAWNQ
jgi:hypothetical protein